MSETNSPSPVPPTSRSGDELMVDITSSSFKPTEKSQGSEFSGTSGVVKVVEGSGGYNHWSFDVDATAFKPDEYIVKVSAYYSGRDRFDLL